MQRVMTTTSRQGKPSPGRPVSDRAGDSPNHDSKALTVRVPTDLWKSVKIKCVQEDTNIQAVLSAYLAAWTDKAR
jgi:hypothetical protein